MKIKEKTPIHFFVADKSNLNWHEIRLQAYLEIPQDNKKTKFKEIEDIHFFQNTNMEKYEVCSYQVSFGRDDCVYSGHDNLKELIQQLQADLPIYGFKIVNKEEYLKFRAKTFELLNQYSFTNYEKLAIGCDI